jgi:prepilin-type processing-associated H-X9-DG protein
LAWRAAAGPDSSFWPDGTTCTQFCGGAQFVFCDGSAHTIGHAASDPNFSFHIIMGKLIRPADGIPVNEEL